MAPDHTEVELKVPPVEAVPVAETMLCKAYTLSLLLAVPLVDAVFATAVKEFSNVPSAGVLLENPIPPIQSSFAWAVVAVVPVVGEVLLPVLFAPVSKDVGVNNPLYSITIAAARRLARVIVIPVPAPDTLGAYQISVVLPEALAACETRDQLAPVWVIALT